MAGIQPKNTALAVRRRTFRLTAGTNRRMGMSFSKPITGLIPPLLVLGLTAASLLFDPFGAVTAVRGGLFDIYENHAPKTSPAANVALITLDSGSLARYGRWPWPTHGLSELTQAATGAKVMVFTTPLDRPEADSIPAPLEPVPAVAPILLGVGGLTPHAIAHFE